MERCNGDIEPAGPVCLWQRTRLCYVLGMRLPEGRQGQILAVALAGAAAFALWLGVVGPVLQWYSSRSDLIAERRTLARHMETIVAKLPDLRRAAAAAAEATPARVLLTGTTDPIAGAELQEFVQDMAEKSGVSVSSAEMLSTGQVGGYRRIGLRVSVYAPQWSALMHFLEFIERGTPRMFVDDLEIHGLPARLKGVTPVDASLTVFGFRLSVSK